MSMIGYFLLASDDDLHGLQADPPTIHGFLDGSLEQGGDVLVDIDKDWHFLHYLLTGTAWGGEPPLNFIVAGGKDIGEEDVGYGPARAFTSCELRAIADALDKIDREELPKRLDGKAMNALEIYPPVNWEEVNVTSEDALYAFDRVRGIADRGRALGHGLLVWCS